MFWVRRDRTLLCVAGFGFWKILSAIQVGNFGGGRTVDKEERTIGCGGEGNKVVSITLSERWMMNERSWERKSSGNRR